MGVGSWITVHVTVLLCIIYVLCELYLFIITLTELSHIVPLGVAGKRTKKE